MAAVIIWPFRLLWNLVIWVINLTGRFVAILIGLVLLLLGVALSATVIGAIIGIPMAVFGGALLLRGLF